MSAQLPPTPENILWDLIESEAEEKYFLDRYEENAELPAILLVSKYSPLAFGGWTVYFGRGIGRWAFKSKRSAHDKIMEIIRSAKWEVYPRIVDRNGKIVRLNKGYPIQPKPMSEHKESKQE